MEKPISVKASANLPNFPTTTSKTLHHLPVKDWLLYAYAVVCPFFAFSIFFTRDTASNWVIALMLGVVLVDFIESGGRFWLDRSLVYLLVFTLIYAISTVYILWNDPSNVWAGRTPLERAIGIDVRLVIVVVSFIAFIHHLVDASPDVFFRILKIQFAIGAIIAIFGLVQYISFTVFHSTALVGFESTNEAFKTRGNLFRLGKERVFRTSAIFSEPSFFGFFLVPLMVKASIAYYKKVYFFSKRAHAVLVGILVLALLSNFSLTAILTLLLLTVVVGIVSFKKNPRLVIAAILVTGVFMGVLILSPLGGVFVGRLERAFEFRDLSTLSRLLQAYTGMLVFADSPLFGTGPGGFAFLFAKQGVFVERGLMQTPLNIWLSVLADVGIVGFLPFVAVLWTIVARAVRRSGSNPLVVVFLWSVVSYLLLLTTVDFWHLDMLWFELAVLLTLSASPCVWSENEWKGCSS